MHRQPSSKLKIKQNVVTNFWSKYVPEVNVEDPNSDEDGEGNKEHGEEEIFAEEGNRQGGRGDDFCQQQEEHSERQQDRYAQRHLNSSNKSNLNVGQIS